MLVLFPVAYLASSKLGIEWLKFIPGVLLIYFLPGYNLNSLIFIKQPKLAWQTKLSLDILSSISILSLAYLPFESLINFKKFPIVALIYCVNLCLFLLAYLVVYRKNSKKKNKTLTAQAFWKDNKVSLIILSIPFLFYIVRLILNPYVYDIDSLVYFDAYSSLMKIGRDATLLFKGREVFPFIMMGSNYVAGMSYIGFFKFFTPLIFYVTSFIAYTLLNPKNNRLVYGAYLLIIASPMLVIMNETVRPETMTIYFSIPIFCLIYKGIREKNITFLLIALAYSFVTIRSHETGYLLTLASVLSFIVILFMNFRNILELIKRNPLVSFFLILPYLGFVVLKYRLFLGFFSTGLTARIIALIQVGITENKFRWWFLNNAVTDTGGQLSWPGITALYYYLYDGIILFLLFLIILAIYLAKKKKITERVDFIALLPVIIFFFVHFAYAEIFPRLGAIVYPNRSWPHIMLALAVITIILINSIFSAKLSNKMSLIIKILIFTTICSGIIGAIFGSTFMGAMVSPKEKGIIEAVKKLPKDAIIISSQRNHNLVKIYAKRNNFIYLKESLHKTEYYYNDSFDKTVIKETGQAADQLSKVELLDPITLFEIKRRIIEKNRETIFVNDFDVEQITDPDKKLRVLKKFDPTSYDMISQSIKEAYDQKNKPLYFLYSFVKLDNGIVSTRPWWRSSADEKNYQFFKNYDNKDQIIAKDNDFILIKIKN